MGERCDITWKDLNFSIDIPVIDAETKQTTMQNRPILKGVSGYAKAGECQAIMGSSGAGKTTLLNILSGKVKAGGNKILTGDILYNGRKLDEDEIADTVGFVMQSDIFQENMTPQETFMFAANLRSNKTDEQKARQVDQIVKDMKLDNARNTIVGGMMKKGISGGEKKRVNIGFELISDPQILFQDEPTSGLDSYTSYIIITLLQKIAQRDMKTVIYTIHQPNSDIFKLFDILMLLMNGRIIFHGSPMESIKYFNDMGGHFKVPGGANPVDHYMFLMQRNVDDLEEYTWLFKHPYTKSILPDVDDSIKILNNLGAKNTRRNKKFAPFFKQFGALLWRANICAARDPILTIMRFAQTIWNTFIILSVWWQISDDPTKADSVHNRGGLLFFSAVFNFIPGMFSVLLSFPVERSVFLKEYQGRFYGVVSYFWAKFQAELPLCLLFPFLLQAFTYYGVNMNNEFQKFLQNILCCCLIGVGGNTMGILIGVIFTDFQIASVVAPVVFYPMMLFSGFYVSSDSLPSWISWLEYFSIFRYGLEFQVVNEFEGSAYVPNPIETFGFDWGKWTCFFAMFGYIMFLRFVGMGILKWSAVNIEQMCDISTTTYPGLIDPRKKWRTTINCRLPGISMKL